MEGNAERITSWQEDEKLLAGVSGPMACSPILYAGAVQLSPTEIVEIRELIEKQKANGSRGPLNAVSAYNHWVPRLLSAYLAQRRAVEFLMEDK